MAKNYLYSGKRVTLELGADVSSGSLCRRNGFIGIPLNHRLAGESVAFAIEGVWGMTYAAYGVNQPVVGTILYWDTNAAILSIGSANDDYPAIKVTKAVSASDGSFEGLLLPQARAAGQDQS